MKSKWHFPLINPVQKYSLKHYLDHIMEEIKEFEEEMSQENKDKEAIDILHSAETFVRKYFEDRKKFLKVKNQVIRKNKKRGYYEW